MTKPKAKAPKKAKAKPRKKSKASKKPTRKVAWIVHSVPIEEVIPYGNNPRRKEKAVGPVQASVGEFGWQQEIVVDTDGVVIVGHTRLAAAEAAGLTEVPVKVSTMSKAKARAYRLADNKTAELAEWEWVKLTDEIRLVDEEGEVELPVLGWTDTELAPMLESDFKPPDDDGSDPHQPGAGLRHQIGFSESEWITIERAVERARGVVDDPEMPANKAIELVCADYLAGV